MRERTNFFAKCGDRARATHILSEPSSLEFDTGGVVNIFVTRLCSFLRLLMRQECLAAALFRECYEIKFRKHGKCSIIAMNAKNKREKLVTTKTARDSLTRSSPQWWSGRSTTRNIVFDLLCFYSFGALSKAAWLFIASLHNQPMYSAKTLINCQWRASYGDMCNSCMQELHAILCLQAIQK